MNIILYIYDYIKNQLIYKIDDKNPHTKNIKSIIQERKNDLSDMYDFYLIKEYDLITEDVYDRAICKTIIDASNVIQFLDDNFKERYKNTKYCNYDCNLGVFLDQDGVGRGGVMQIHDCYLDFRTLIYEVIPFRETFLYSKYHDHYNFCFYDNDFFIH